MVMLCAVFAGKIGCVGGGWAIIELPTQICTHVCSTDYFQLVCGLVAALRVLFVAGGPRECLSRLGRRARIASCYLF